MKLLSKQEIDYFKENQDKITFELLEALRSHGNAGKSQALEILETPQNERRYHLDAFGLPISFDGNKGLKKPDTQMNLSPIHLEEIERCHSDFDYFRNNYVRIKTKSGIDFPDIRGYQQRFISELLASDTEEVVGLMGRQCIAGSTKLDMQDVNMTIEELFNTV